MNSCILYISAFNFEGEPAAKQRLMANAAMLRELGYDVIFVSSSTNKEKIGIKHPFYINGYKVYAFPTPKKFIQRMKFKVSRLFLDDIIKTESNIVATIIYDYPAIAMDRIARLSRNNGIIAIAECAEWYAANGNILEKAVLATDVFLRMNIVQFKMEGLILASSYLMNHYRKFAGPRLQLPTLMDYNDPKWDICNYVRDKSSGKIIISTIGVLNVRANGRGKDELTNVVSFLNQARKTGHRDIELRVIGTSEELYRSLYPEEYENLDFVHFLGRLPHRDTLREISNSDFFFFYRERSRVNMAGFPTKFGESIACGTPVITTNTSDLPDYLIEGVNGFFISENKDEAVKKLERILSLTFDDIMKMHENCRQNRMLDYHSFKNNTKMFMNALFEKSS